MRQHPVIGYNVLKSLDFLRNALPVVLHHQERYDGRGYPNGLKGEEIPLFARIFCIADSFDAMISDRPYRRAMRPEKAVEEIKKNSRRYARRQMTWFKMQPGVAWVESEKEAERLAGLPSNQGKTVYLFKCVGKCKAEPVSVKWEVPR